MPDVVSQGMKGVLVTCGGHCPLGVILQKQFVGNWVGDMITWVGKLALLKGG